MLSKGFRRIHNKLLRIITSGDVIEGEFFISLNFNNNNAQYLGIAFFFLRKKYILSESCD